MGRSRALQPALSDMGALRAYGPPSVLSLTFLTLSRSVPSFRCVCVALRAHPRDSLMTLRTNLPTPEIVR